MINVDSLPKSITYNDEIYFLNLHVTMFNKICVCYQYAFTPRLAREKNIEYNIFSQVVEPKMNIDDIKVIEKTSNVEDIFDVPDFELAFDYLSARLNQALRYNLVELYK